MLTSIKVIHKSKLIGLGFKRENSLLVGQAFRKHNFPFIINDHATESEHNSAGKAGNGPVVHSRFFWKQLNAAPSRELSGSMVFESFSHPLNQTCMNEEVFRKIGKKMLETLSWRVVLSTVVGAGLGFAYYRFVGCRSGACPISSNPFISTIYGGVLGFIWGMK